VLQPSSLKEISSRDYEGGEVLGNKEQSGGPLLDLGETNIGVINSRVEIVLTISENLQTETSFRVGSALTTTTQKKGWRKCLKSLAKPQGQGLMITKIEGLRLVRVRDTLVVFESQRMD
jgi:hypothetical protein